MLDKGLSIQTIDLHTRPVLNMRPRVMRPRVHVGQKCFFYKMCEITFWRTWQKNRLGDQGPPEGEHLRSRRPSRVVDRKRDPWESHGRVVGEHLRA